MFSDSFDNSWIYDNSFGDSEVKNADSKSRCCSNWRKTIKLCFWLQKCISRPKINSNKLGSLLIIQGRFLKNMFFNANHYNFNKLDIIFQANYPKKKLNVGPIYMIMILQ